VWVNLERGEAVAVLREIADNQRFNPRWVSLVNGKSGSYELHINPESVDLAFLKTIVSKHDLAMKENNGYIVIYAEHDGFQDP
jgi:hypothetical protein